MKTLHIVRHAKSSWKNGDLADHDRPLNKRGKINAPFMAEKFADEYTVDKIFSSTAKRALSTAKHFAKALGIPKRDIVTTRDIYHASIGALMDEVNAMDDSYQEVMIFGHNPGLSSLVYFLDHNAKIEMVTCARATIKFEVENWSSVTENLGQIVSYDYPRRYVEMEDLRNGID